MFHKFAIIVNSFLLIFPWFVYYFLPVLKFTCHYFGIWFLQSHISLSKVLIFFVFLILLLIFSFLFIIITSLATRIKVGIPPIGSCFIAYKYGLSDTVTGSTILIDKVNFPNNDIIHICYERKGSLFGIAHGAIISEKVNENTKEKFVQHGYNVFETMSASNAMFISCPTLPWLSFLGSWVVLHIVYPRFYKYSKTHRLSAYPVVEVYRRFSVVLMAPLSQQDLFLVPEAKLLLNRSCSAKNLTLNSTTNRSCSSLKYSRSHTFDSISTTVIDNNNVEPKFIHTSTPILSNGSAKQGYED